MSAYLAAILGTSKTPVREALKVLAQRGLVQATPYRGTTVRVIDRETARQIFEVRLTIEPDCVRRLAGTTTTRLSPSLPQL